VQGNDMPFLEVARCSLFKLNSWISHSIFYQDISVYVATEKNILVVTADSQLAVSNRQLVCSVCCVRDLVDFPIKKQTKLHGFSPQANYTDRAITASRRS
jgi:hypothetical protein